MAQHQWGSLSYTADGAFKFHDIFINSIAQAQSLDGSSAQSRNQRHFYPRAHMPGDVVVEGICMSQDSYQELALFIRQHQRMLLNTPNEVRYQFPRSAGSQRLLTLDVPTENNHWQGFIKTFGMVKKGIMVPAPTYTFSFVVIFDSTSENIGLSNRVMRNYTAGSRSGPTITPGTNKVAQ